jgi:hypothetical protein
MFGMGSCYEAILHSNKAERRKHLQSRGLALRRRRRRRCRLAATGLGLFNVDAQRVECALQRRAHRRTRVLAVLAKRSDEGSVGAHRRVLQELRGALLRNLRTESSAHQVKV